MELLQLEHQDFLLSIRCSDIATPFVRAQSRQRDFFNATSYSATAGRIQLVDSQLIALQYLSQEKTHPIIFENKDYTIGIRFLAEADSIDSPYVHSKVKDIQQKFFYEPSLKYLSGTINFGNDLGKFDLVVRYTKNQKPCECTLVFEVFPTKLDYSHDYKQIIKDIEEEYPYLVLDFLKKTYSSFQSGTSPNTDLIWWQIFGGLYERFLKASKFILNRPHSRIVKTSRKVRADRVVRWNRALEERFAEFKDLPHTLYHADQKTLSTDTPENRFFKYAIQQTSRKYKRLKAYVLKTFEKNVSDSFRTELIDIEREMDVLSNNPFFKSISDFRGLRQESLVLQKASGYSTVYKCWLMLNSGLRFLDGIQRIELKNIADLYQVWCFLSIKSLLQQILGKPPDTVKLAEIQVDRFVFKIVRGVNSKVSFVRENGDVVDLYHDFSYGLLPDDDGLRSFTVDQRPDIVLRISKSDLRDQYGLTYLFDAKYRLQSDEKEGAPDSPPEDAINQMHRYRDAIYFTESRSTRPQKEVLGGYVLFPGRGDLEGIAAAPYLKSVADVNIGAFPLVPGHDETKVFLRKRLGSILRMPTETALQNVAPQKRSNYEPFNPEVLIGIVPDEHHARCFRSDGDRLYYTGKQKPSRFGYSSLKYFAPYLMGQGIDEYYEILGYEVLPRNKIFDSGHPLDNPADQSERLVLHLGTRFPLTNGFHKLTDGFIRHFRYTNLYNLRNPTEQNKIDVLVVGRMRHDHE